MALFGTAELGARFVPAVAALSLVGITAWLGTVAVSTDVGVVAALLLALSPGIFALARYAILDTLFAALLFGGAALAAIAALDDRPALQWGGYVLAGLAVLTKGPVAIVLCGLAFLISAALSRDVRRRLLGLHWPAGIVIVAAISLPWYVYMWGRFASGFVHGHLLNENVLLFARPMYSRQPGIWFYFRILAAGLLPWTGLLLGRLYDDAQKLLRGVSVDPFETLLWAWTLTVVGFFTFSRFKLDHYVFPAAPAVSLLCARAYADVRRAPDDPLNVGSRFGLRCVGPLLVALGTGAGFFVVLRLDLPRMAAIVPLAMTIAGMLVTIQTNAIVPRYPRVPAIAASAMVVAYAGIVMWVIPVLEQRKVVPDVAHWVASRAAPADRVASYRLNRWQAVFRFYVVRHTAMLETPAEAREFFNRPEPFYCVMLAPAYDEFVAQGVPLRVVYRRDGMWATSGRALWRRRIPPTRFVVVTRADSAALARPQP